LKDLDKLVKTLHQKKERAFTEKIMKEFGSENKDDHTGELKASTNAINAQTKRTKFKKGHDDGTDEDKDGDGKKERRRRKKSKRGHDNADDEGTDEDKDEKDGNKREKDEAKDRKHKGEKLPRISKEDDEAEHEMKWEEHKSN